MDGLLETVQASAHWNLFWGPPPQDYFFERAEAAILRMPEDIRENFVSWYQLLSLGCLGLFLLHECAHAFWKTEPEQCIALSGLGELPCSGPEREYAADALACALLRRCFSGEGAEPRIPEHLVLGAVLAFAYLYSSGDFCIRETAAHPAVEERLKRACDHFSFSVGIPAVNRIWDFVCQFLTSFSEMSQMF
ncbi:MAG: hypothetical protein MR014_08920 [Oscillospiraceae bacterium]|nr:hypothetical protein [Oscillospiraceae bacterium]